jgi:hypothetical protein
MMRRKVTKKASPTMSMGNDAIKGYDAEDFCPVDQRDWSGFTVTEEIFKQIQRPATFYRPGGGYKRWLDPNLPPVEVVLKSGK